MIGEMSDTETDRAINNAKDIPSMKEAIEQLNARVGSLEAINHIVNVASNAKPTVWLCYQPKDDFIKPEVYCYYTFKEWIVMEVFTTRQKAEDWAKGKKYTLLKEMEVK